MQNDISKHTRKLSLVPPKNTCKRTPYPSEARAREVIWLMTNKGVDTGKLRPHFCTDCRLYHLKYVR